MSINVVFNVPFSRRMAGFSDVLISKDRHGGGPDATGEHRHVAQLHIKPGMTLTASAGSACGPCRCDSTAEKFSLAHVSREVEAQRTTDRAQWYADRPGVLDAREVMKRYREPTG